MNPQLTKLAVALVHTHVAQGLSETGKTGAYKYAALIEATLGYFLDYKADTDRMSITEQDILAIMPSYSELNSKTRAKILKETQEQFRILNGRMKSTEKFLRDQLQVLDSLSEQMQEELYKHATV